MNENGFDLCLTPSEKMNELKIALGIPEQVRGCHTTVIDGIIVEWKRHCVDSSTICVALSPQNGTQR